MRGEKLQRLTLHKRATPADDFIASDEVVTEVCEVRASIVPKGGNESEAGDRQQAIPGVTISMRWGHTIAAIDSTWWATREHPVTHETETYHFTSVVNVGERNKEVVIEAVRA